MGSRVCLRISRYGRRASFYLWQLSNHGSTSCSFCQSAVVSFSLWMRLMQQHGCWSQGNCTDDPRLQMRLRGKSSDLVGSTPNFGVFHLRDVGKFLSPEGLSSLAWDIWVVGDDYHLSGKHCCSGHLNPTQGWWYN